MKRIVCLVLILALMGTSLNFQVFALDQQVQVPAKEISHVDSEGNLILAKIRTRDDDTIVDVYINDVHDHTAITNLKNDSVTLEHHIGANKGVENFKASDFIVESRLSDNEINNDYPPSTPPGFTFATSVYSSSHGARGYLFERGDGEIMRYSHRTVKFTTGTAIGVVIGLIGVFITGAVTLPIILTALGTGLAGGIITSFIDSQVYFVDIKTSYRGFCRGIQTLNTHQVLKYARAQNNKNSGEDLLYVGYKSGYRGTKADIAYGAILNYFN